MFIHNQDRFRIFTVFSAADIICLLVSYILAFFLRFNISELSLGLYVTTFFGYAVTVIICNKVLSLTDNILTNGYLKLFISVLLLSFFSLSSIALVFFAIKQSVLISRLLLFYTASIFIIVDYIGRILTKDLYLKYFIPLNKSTNAFLLTTSKSVSKFISEISTDELNPINIKGVYCLDDDKLSILGIKVFYSALDALKYICHEWIDEVIIYNPNGNIIPEEFDSRCMEMGLTIHHIVNIEKIERDKQYLQEIGPYSSLTVVYNYITPSQAFIKRVIDIIGSIVGCIITLILTVIIGPLILISSPGPIFFRQKRIGKNGKCFYLLKFRSMYKNAEKLKQSISNQNIVADSMMFKIPFDTRVIGNKIMPDGTHKTGLGNFIRTTSIDEFPQFFNVLKGDMSLVGTRPPTEDEWIKYDYHHRARLAMKPGITGMWQISGRNKITDFEQVVKLDTEYITHFGLRRDIIILFKTILVVLRRRNAY